MRRSFRNTSAALIVAESLVPAAIRPSVPIEQGQITIRVPAEKFDGAVSALRKLGRVKNELVTILARVRVRSEEEVAALEAEQQRKRESAAMEFQHASSGGYGADEEAAEVQAERERAQAAAPVVQTVVRDQPKVGRNDPCPCGSGKKYKQCHGRLA